MRVLVVDDQAQLRVGIARLLTREGHEVVEKSNGVAALKWLGKNVPDAILSDNDMPLMDGLQLLQYVRKDLRFSAVKFILWSGSVDPGLSLACNVEGGIYLSKRSKPEAVLAELSS